VDYFVDHLEELTNDNAEMIIENTELIEDIAEKVHIDRLDSMKDKNSRLVSRLFANKIFLMF